jgi:ABC-type transport system involved in multi-copper enzyme maturation permease subunit
MRTLAAGLRFYWARALVAGFAIFSFLQWFSLNSLSAGGGAAGKTGLQLLSILGLVLALGAVFITADAVNHERREGTLPLLFLSTLQSHDVVFGKIAALGLVALYGLLGLTPVLMLTLMNGGVTSGEVIRLTLALVNVLFLSLAVGLLVSVVARSQFGAILNAVGLLAGIALGPYLLDLGGRASAISLSSLSPLVSVALAADANAYATYSARYWWSLGLSHLEAWVLLALASGLLARNWKRLHQPRAVRSAVAQSRRLLGAPRVLVAGRENRRAFAPVARAVLRLPRQQALAWLAAAISVCGSIWNAFVMNRLGIIWLSVGVSAVFSLASLGIFAFLAGRFFFESRRSGELELLLVTPVGARGILREQQLALLRILRGPFYLTLLGVIPLAASAIAVSEGNEMMGLLLALCQLAGTALGIVATCSVAMWLGSRVNSALALVGWSVGLVEILPLIAVFLLPMLLPGSFGAASWSTLIPLVLVIKNPIFIWWAWSRLERDFRTRPRRLFSGLLRRLLSTETVPPVDSRPQPVS